MPEIETIIIELRQFIRNTILKQPDLTIQENEPIISSGLIDSFSLVDLALFIEDHFGVHIDDTELNADFFDSISQLAEIIDQRQIS